MYGISSYIVGQENSQKQNLSVYNKLLRKSGLINIEANESLLIIWRKTEIGISFHLGRLYNL